MQSALDSGAPPSLSESDFDTEPPANVDDSALSISTTSLNSNSDEIATDTSLQRFLLSSLPARLEVVKRMNSAKSTIEYDRLKTLAAEMERACRRCGAYIAYSDESTSTTFKHNMADLLIRRFLLLVHRSAATADVSSDLRALSRRCSFDTAATLLSPLPNDEFKQITICGGGLFKGRIIHASLAVCSEVLVELENKSVGPSTYVQQPSMYWNLLLSALREALNQSALRIQNGESNVRMHMKATIVLALAEAGDHEIPIQQRMAQAAKSSLELSLAAMTARAHLSAVQTPNDEQYTILTDDPQWALCLASPFNFEEFLFDHSISDLGDSMHETGLLIDT